MKRTLWILLTIFALTLAACGPAVAPTPTVAPPTPTVAPTPVPPTPTKAALDVKAVVDRFLSGIPDKYYTVGTVEALKDMLAAGNVVLVDVREPNEYAEGHIPGAVNIPIRHRAGMATAALQLLGYTNVRNFTPAIVGWKDAGEPLSTEPVEARSVGQPQVDPELLAVVDRFLSGIPDKYYTVGTVEALKDMLAAGNVVLVDVREPNEYAEGHIPGAVNIPIRTLAKNLDKLPKDKPVVVYCRTGHRAGMATAALQLLGYTNVRNFTPAIVGWQKAGEPVEKAQ
jgi:rhodanese-related sulfurtransferase